MRHLIPSSQPTRTAHAGTHAGVTRRGLFRGTVAAGAAVAAVGLLDGCTHASEEAGEPTVVDSTSATYVIDPETNESNYASVNFGMKAAATYSLPVGTVLRPSVGTWIAATAVGETSNPMVVGSALSATSGELVRVVTETSSDDPNVAIFEVSCSDEAYAWVEMNLLDKSWTLYASAFADGALTGATSRLWEADANWDPPRLAVAGNRVLWLVMPALSGEKTTESSHCYLWKLGAADAQAVVESPGRFATSPAVSGDTVTLVPRVRASEGVYYGITAYSLSSDLATVVDQLVLPRSVSPMYAVRIGGLFVFSVEASYSSGGLLATMGTYIGTGEGPFVVLSREPAAEAAGREGLYFVKSRSSYFVIDTEHDRYDVLSAADRSVDYGDFPARDGVCESFVTYATVKDPNTGYPTAVVVRSYEVASIGDVVVEEGSEGDSSSDEGDEDE